MCAAWLASLALGGPVHAHGSFHDRIEAASRAVAERPDDPRAHLVRAELRRRHGNFAEALDDLDRAAALSADPGALDYFRGRLFLDSGRPAEAEAALDRFLAREPEHPAARAARAEARIALGRPLDAARDLSHAIAHQPVPVPAYYLERAEVLAGAGDAHLDEALEGLDEGLDAIGPVVTLQRAAIDLEVRRGAVDAALARLDRAAAASPRQASWLAWRGEILEGAGREGAALAAYEQALGEIEGLAPGRRSSDAVAALETRLRAAVERLSRADAVGSRR